MIQALKDNDSGVRTIAAQSLGWINDTRAIDPLAQVLNDKNEDKYVQDAAAQALERLGKPVTQTAQ
jgi:HEAT repeat protein